MSLADNKKSILFKFLSIFSVVRIYNILLIVIAQYLTSIFILTEKNFMDIVLDLNLFLISELIKTVANANKSLLDLQRQRRQYDPNAGPDTINNNFRFIFFCCSASY